MGRWIGGENVNTPWSYKTIWNSKVWITLPETTGWFFSLNHIWHKLTSTLVVGENHRLSCGFLQLKVKLDIFFCKDMFQFLQENVFFSLKFLRIFIFRLPSKAGASNTLIILVSPVKSFLSKLSSSSIEFL